MKNWLKDFIAYSIIGILISILYDILIKKYGLFDPRLLTSFPDMLMVSLLCSIISVKSSDKQDCIGFEYTNSNCNHYENSNV